LLSFVAPPAPGRAAELGQEAPRCPCGGVARSFLDRLAGMRVRFAERPIQEVERLGSASRA
jgi:hypothetical protein